MTKTLNSERPRLISIYEFQHHSKMVKNRAYAINLIDKAISTGQRSIDLDKSKLEHKVYTGTTCYMYNRFGEPMSIYSKNSNKVVIQGCSSPQHGDKFSRYEGRYNALKNAYSNMQLIKNDPNFDDLLTVKRFINTFELEVNCTTVSYQFMDLWLAVLSNNDEEISAASIKYVGQQQYDGLFANCLLGFKEAVTDFELCEGVLNSIDKYTMFKSFIKGYNSSLF